MAVLYGASFVAQEVKAALTHAKVPHQWLSRDAGGVMRLDPDADQVRVLTMHSSKGLEFPVVAIAGLGYLPRKMETIADDARLLYVAMTRSTERLLMTHHRESSFTSRLQGSLDALAA